jgi:hypothetical protein
MSQPLIPKSDKVPVNMLMHPEELRERSDVLFALGRRPYASTAEDYIASLLGYVTIKWEHLLLGSPVVDLNRRFQLLGSTFGMSPSNVVMELAYEKKVIVERHRAKLIVFPYEKWISMLDSIKDPEIYKRQFDMICDASLADVGIRIKAPKSRPRK